MHIDIDAECRRGLRIIEEIPNIPLCKLEGYNGIGKTSAIRLLRLCVGEQPFESNDSAWRTFRDQLIRARVQITELRGAKSIEWQLDPHEWPNQRAELLGDRVGSIIIDGRKATIRDLPELLKIHHINTTETPIQILKDRISSAASAIESWYVGKGAPRAEQSDQLLEPVLKILRTASTAEIRLRREVVTTAHQALEHISSQAVNSRTRVQILERAAEAADRLDTVRGSSPQIESKLRDLSRSLSDIDKAGEILDAKIAEAHIQQRQTQEALEQYEKAKRLVSRHDGSLRRSTDELMRVAAEANIDPSHERITQTADNLSKRLDALIKSQPNVGAAPQMLALLNDLVRRLDNAMSSNLGDRILVERNEDRLEWTVASFRHACQAQIEQLLELSQGPDADRLATEIVSVRNRLDKLARVDQSLQAVEKFESWLEQARVGLEEARRDLALDPSDQLADLLRQRSERELEGREFQSRIDRLRLELELLGGGHTEEVLANELETLCREIGVEASRVRGSFERERTALGKLSQQEAAALATYQSATRALDEQLGIINRAVDALANGESYLWLRNAIPNVSELPTFDLDRRLSELDNLAKELNSARNTLTTTMAGVRGIGGALDALAKALGNTSNEVKRPQLWTAPAGRWLGLQVQQWFDDEIMRETLFSGGRNVRLDPSDLTVSWKVGDDDYKRPLGFFSSGQQAFAFTRARVAQLDRDVEGAANRLIALDEFGAFLDAKRLHRMAEFLTQREPHNLRDQVLVILPCSVAPVDAASDSGPLRGRDADLARRGYFTEEFRV